MDWMKIVNSYLNTSHDWIKYFVIFKIMMRTILSFNLTSWKIKHFTCPRNNWIWEVEHKCALDICYLLLWERPCFKLVMRNDIRFHSFSMSVYLCHVTILKWYSLILWYKELHSYIWICILISFTLSNQVYFTLKQLLLCVNGLLRAIVFAILWPERQRILNADIFRNILYISWQMNSVWIR